MTLQRNLLQDIAKYFFRNLSSAGEWYLYKLAEIPGHKVFRKASFTVVKYYLILIGLSLSFIVFVFHSSMFQQAKRAFLNIFDCRPSLSALRQMH